MADVKTARVKWGKYADGELHTFTEDDIQRRHGISSRGFRSRLSQWCSKKGRKYSCHKTLGVFYLRIFAVGVEDTGNDSGKPRARDFADGEVHEIPVSTILDEYGYGEVKQFRNLLRGYVRTNPECQLSFQATETAVTFCMGPRPLKWEAFSQGGWNARA